MKVLKRNGESEDYDIEKIHKVVEWATNDITGVSFSDVELKQKRSIRY